MCLHMVEKLMEKQCILSFPHSAVVLDAHKKVLEFGKLLFLGLFGEVLFLLLLSAQHQSMIRDHEKAYASYRTCRGRFGGEVVNES